MLAVHAFWSPGRGVLFWAEDGDRPVTSRSQALRTARPHPFAASADLLAELHAGTPETATLLLPSLRSSPLDSPDLVRAAPRPAAQRPPALLPWSVPALLVEPAELATPSEHVRYGASVIVVRALAAFAADLAARGRVLPAVVSSPTIGGSPGEPAAHWRPLLAGPDAARLAALVAALPPVGRAESTGPGDRAGRDPGELLTDALGTLVDTAVRDTLVAAIGPGGLLPPRRGRRPRRLPAAELWLDALTAPSPAVAPGENGLDTADIDRLARALHPWERAAIGSVGPARALFRLTDASEEAPESWRLEFWLQSVADPSLQVPADAVWTAPDGLRRWIDQPQEALLGELGRAGAVWPELVPALRAARPGGLDLDVHGAAEFLSAGAGRLDAAGFGVSLPGWWQRGRRFGLVAAARSTPTDAAVVAAGLDRDTLAAFDWSIAVGGDVLTEEEIAELVAAKAPLVRLRGQWVAVDADRLRRGLEFLRTAPTPRTAAEVVALARSHPDDLDLPLPLTEVRADGWLGDLLTGSADRTLTPLEPPASFTAKLRPYQQRGLAWLGFLTGLGLGGCLADDMGLGKTIQLLALECTDRAEAPRPPTLLVCPMSLVGNWQREAARFAPDLRVYAHHGPGRLHGEPLSDQLRDTDLVLTTYATATRDMDELESGTWHRLVLDEAQAIKNSLATAAQAVRRVRAPSRIALTGTPVENRLAELWALMDVLNPGILGSREQFRRRFAVPVERHADPDAAALLRRITRPYLLRRVKTDPTVIDDLPAKIEMRTDYRLTVEQASLYRTVVDDMMTRIEESDGIARRGNVLAAMTKLKQVCNHPAQLLHDGSAIGRRSGKVTRLVEILTEAVAEGDKVLCFTQFTEFGELLVPHLTAELDTEVLFLHGGTPRARRDEMVARFQADGGPQVFLLSLKAGGTGLTLTAANHVVHLDRWWNPAVEDQATDRAFRIGQRRTVQVHKFCAAGTLEERIEAIIERKKGLAGLIIGDGEQWLTELSTGELRDLFALAADAVDE